MEDIKIIEKYINEQFKCLKHNGYMVLDLVRLQYYTKEEILEMQKICMEDYYSYFTDRGIERNEVEISLTEELIQNKYFKQPKESKMFSAMYGHTTKDNRKYINTRKPANAINCGMGTATSQVKTYKNEKLCKYRERLRPFMESLYRGPVKRHLSRFGLKLPPGKDMELHTDTSYVEEYKDSLPKPRDPDDPISYHSFSDNGVAQRYQMVLALNNSDSGWYGYAGAHLKYKEIGELLSWPGKSTTLQRIPLKVMKELKLKRVNIKSKIGEAIIWNCGIPHGNLKCEKVPRLTLYIDYQPDKENTTAETVVGLGNQPNGK